MSEPAEVNQEWRWQVDPLSNSGRVQIANKDGVILAEVASIKSAEYVTNRLNPHTALLAALEALSRLGLHLTNGCANNGEFNPDCSRCVARQALDAPRKGVE